MRSGRVAAYKVAIKNARRNRKRTVFLALLVAVPVAFGIVTTGVVRASGLTQEESAQGYFGSADARIQVMYTTDPGVVDWVNDTTEEIAPGTKVTEMRAAGIRVEGAGYASVWDLDPSDPATEGLLVLVSGDLPRRDGEVALSPALADALQIERGDIVRFEYLPLGELKVVGLVAEPFGSQNNDILVAPGTLAPLGRDPVLGVQTALLLSGPEAETAADQLWDLWYQGGQQLFWPEPAVDPLPPELQFLDPQIYLLLDRTEIEELAQMARTTSGTRDQVMVEVWDRANQMIYGNGSYRSLPDIYIETRSQWLSYGGLEDRPGVMSSLASAVLLVEVAFITGAAFAAGTRRRLREIGLMSANGASQEHVRSTVVGEGLTIGAIGAGAGVLLGIGVLVLGRPVIQRFVSRVITGLGVGPLDLLGPVVVALASVLFAVLIPARTASRVPTTTALQGRMPALSPRRWVVPLGVGMAATGFVLISVALLSQSVLANLLVGVGAVVTVAGVAMLSSPILATLARLSDRVPATSRLVLRDSGRNRTRSSVAVAAIMVVLLAPVSVLMVSATEARNNLVYGLPDPGDQLVLSGSFRGVNLGEPQPITEADVAELASILPERDVAVFDSLDLRVVTDQLLRARDDPVSGPVDVNFFGGYPVAVGNADLVRVLDSPGLADVLDHGEVAVLGIADRETRVEINDVVYPAHEFPVPLVRWKMPRILIPESMASDFEGVKTRPLALFTLSRPVTDEESQEISDRALDVYGGRADLDATTVFLLVEVATMLVVLLVVALVTAVSAAEVDEEIQTIVAVGAAGSIRRRFLGLLAGYQTLVAMVLAVPLGLSLVSVFSARAGFTYVGPFGVVDASNVAVPWGWLLPFAVLLPIVIGLITLASVRSAPVTPPRRAT